MRSESHTLYGTIRHFTPTGKLAQTTVNWKRRYTLDRADIVKGRVVSGWRAPKPYEASYFGVYVEGAHRSSDGYRIEGSIGSQLATVPSLPGLNAGLRSRAEVQALNNLKDQKVNLAQFFAERKMTERLFVDTASSIANGIKGVMRKDPRAVERALGLSRRGGRKLDRAWKRLDPTRRWLEYQYGWLPLLNDVHGAAEELRRKDRNALRITTKGKAFEDQPFSQVYREKARLEAPHMWSGQTRVEYRVSLTYVPSPSWWTALTRTGFTNPLQLQWELVPFSFVVDWFLPIGNFLSSLDATAGYEFLGGSLTIYRQITVAPGDMVSRSYKGNYTSGLRGNARRMSMVRTTYGSSPIPTLPRMRAPWAVNGANRIANAMSLLAQAFGRGK